MADLGKRRNFHTKAKTGCKSCKLRKIKCDEAKPKCFRCVKTKKDICEYEDVVVKPVKKKPVVTSSRLMALAPKPDGSYPYYLMPSVPGSLKRSSAFDSERDFQYYSHYITAFLHIKPHTSYLGAFESDLWSRLLPQAAAEEDFARHAVIACGAVNKAAETSQALTLGNNMGIGERNSLYNSNRISSDHHAASLQHYGKAIKLIQEQFSDRTLDAHRLQNALVACTLFCLLEHAYGGLEAALQPLQAGVNLLLDFQEDRRKHNFVGVSLIDSDLLDIFLHYESIIHRVKGKTDQGNVLTRLIDDTTALEHIPFEFSSLRQSRLYLDLIHRRLQKSPVKQWKPIQATLPASIARQSNLQNERPVGNIAWDEKLVSQWQNAFSPLLQKCRADVQNTPDLMAATYLDLRLLLLDIDLDHLDCQTKPCSDETVLDSCKTVAAITSQLLESNEVIIMRGPTIPRYDMLLEEVVSLLLRMADLHHSEFLEKLAHGIQDRYGQNYETDGPRAGEMTGSSVSWEGS